MSEATATAGAGTAYAGFWRRFVAGFIDTIILLVPMFGIAMVMGVTMIPDFNTMDPNAMSVAQPVVFVIAMLVLVWAYKAILESSSWQATVGKKMLGLKVTTMDGQKVSLMQATMRTWPFWLAYLMQVIESLVGMGGILSTAVSLAGLVALIVIAFTPKKQGVHDMIAKTLVVR